MRPALRAAQTPRDAPEARAVGEGAECDGIPMLSRRKDLRQDLLRHHCDLRARLGDAGAGARGRGLRLLGVEQVAVARGRRDVVGNPRALRRPQLLVDGKRRVAYVEIKFRTPHAIDATSSL